MHQQVEWCLSHLKNVLHHLDYKHWKAGIDMALTPFRKLRCGSYLVFGMISLFDISVVMELICYPECLVQSTYLVNNEMNKFIPRSMTQRYLKWFRDLIHARPQGSRPLKLTELHNVKIKRNWPRFQLYIEKVLTSKGHMNTKQGI